MAASPHGTWDANLDRFHLVVEDVHGVVGRWSANGELLANDVTRHGIHNGGLSRTAAVPVDTMRCPEVSEARHGG